MKRTVSRQLFRILNCTRKKKQNVHYEVKYLEQQPNDGQNQNYIISSLFIWFSHKSLVLHIHVHANKGIVLILSEWKRLNRA